MFVSSVSLLAATLVMVAAMPTTPAGETTSPRALCKSALVRTPMGTDLAIMKTCCSTETSLTEDQCQVVLQAMNEAPAETTPKGAEIKLNGTDEREVQQNKFTLEMLDAEPIIMKCLMRTVGMVSAEGVINETTVRYLWNKRVLSTAGEEEKKKLVAAIDTCPLTSNRELVMYPFCLVKTCSAAA